MVVDILSFVGYLFLKLVTQRHGDFIYGRILLFPLKHLQWSLLGSEDWPK